MVYVTLSIVNIALQLYYITKCTQKATLNVENFCIICYNPNKKG